MMMVMMMMATNMNCIQSSGKIFLSTCLELDEINSYWYSCLTIFILIVDGFGKMNSSCCVETENCSLCWSCCFLGKFSSRGLIDLSGSSVRAQWLPLIVMRLCGTALQWIRPTYLNIFLWYQAVSGYKCGVCTVYTSFKRNCLSMCTLIPIASVATSTHLLGGK